MARTSLMSLPSLRSDGPAPPPEAPAPISFANLPRPGQNHVIWQGYTATPNEVATLVERATGYQVETMWRLSYGGWQSFRPWQDPRANYLLIDPSDRLVVSLSQRQAVFA